MRWQKRSNQKRRPGLQWSAGAERAAVPTRGHAQWNAGCGAQGTRELPPSTDYEPSEYALQHVLPLLSPGAAFFLRTAVHVDSRWNDPHPEIRQGDAPWHLSPTASFAAGTVAVYLRTVRRNDRCNAADAAIRDMYGKVLGSAVRKTYPVFLVAGSPYLFPCLDLLMPMDASDEDVEISVENAET